jgi:hypothetical protein
LVHERPLARLAGRYRRSWSEAGGNAEYVEVLPLKRSPPPQQQLGPP